MATALLPLFAQGFRSPTQVATQQADPLGQRLGECAKPPLEGAPRREAPVFAQQLAQGAHLFCGLIEHRQQLAHPMQAPDDHDHQRLEEQGLGVDVRASSAGSARERRVGETIDKADELDKDRTLVDHERASEGRVLGHTPSSEAFLARSSPSSVPHAIYDQPSVS